eukprot:6367978-Pyramimonas_sp.AAC.1
MGAQKSVDRLPHEGARGGRSVLLLLRVLRRRVLREPPRTVLDRFFLHRVVRPREAPFCAPP